ncbi:MAG: RNA recognition motif domain-containing protein [Bdellovibrionota bacterium]
MNIYVGNLVYAVTGDELKELFSQYGQVESASIITFRSGKSKGFGFVTMPNDDEAKTAIEALNGSDLQGRTMVVNEARPKEERQERQERGPRGHRGGGFRQHDGHHGSGRPNGHSEYRREEE